MSILRLKAEGPEDLGPAELIDTVLVPIGEADPRDRFVGQPGCLSPQMLGHRGGEGTHLPHMTFGGTAIESAADATGLLGDSGG